MAAQAVAVAPPRAKIRVRRDVRWLTAGVLAVALGGLGSWALYTQLADTRPVLKLAHTVYRGQVIGAGDLGVVAIGRTTDLPGVSGDDLNSVVGQTARTDLAQGTLLVKDSYGKAELPSGVARVGLKIDSGRLPSTPLPPGTQVQVVALPAPGGAADVTKLPASVDAVLTKSPAPASDGSYVIDLDVATTSAETVARLGALKQVVIIQKAMA